MRKKDQFQSVIKVAKNLNIEKDKFYLILSGPLGLCRINLAKLDQKGSVSLYREKSEKFLIIKSKLKPFFTSLQNKIKDKIKGVSQGFLVYLRIVGIGYRFTLKENTLILKLGFSHNIKYKIPSSIRVFLIEPTLISLFGIDKNQVTQIAAKIRRIKPPSPYKGKGIRLLDETVFIKEGKKK